MAELKLAAAWRQEVGVSEAMWASEDRAGVQASRDREAVLDAKMTRSQRVLSEHVLAPQMTALGRLQEVIEELGPEDCAALKHDLSGLHFRLMRVVAEIGRKFGMPHTDACLPWIDRGDVAAFRVAAEKVAAANRAGVSDA